jgi:hypothetical protein
MARYALVIDGVVTEERNYDSPPQSKVRDGKALLRPIQEVTAEYNPDTQAYTISREVRNNKVVDTWIVQDLPRDQVDAKLLAALAARRFAVETGGVTIGPVTIQTDRETRANLIAARIKAKEDPTYSVKWKTPLGFVPLDATTIIIAADTAAAHVQKCFESEAAVAQGVSGYGSTAEILAAFDQLMAE